MPFRALVGHRRLLELLARSMAGGSLPPSLIFGGPEGTGKALVACSVAQALNCLEPTSAGHFALDACGVCAACRRIARGVHPDVVTVEPGDSGSIRIEQIRDAIDRAMYRPFEGRRRVVIIDPADAMAAPPQNALLKILEEPPAASVFILVTARPDMLLPTVRSRCARLRFGRLSAAEVAGVLVRDRGYADADARAAAALADGSVRRALETREADVVAARSTACDVLRKAAAARDPKRRLANAALLSPPQGYSSAEGREHVAVHLRAMSSLLRDLAILSNRADDRALANIDLRPALQGLAGAFDGQRAVRAFTAVDQALGALERNAGPKIVADWVALQL